MTTMNRTSPHEVTAAVKLMVETLQSACSSIKDYCEAKNELQQSTNNSEMGGLQR